MNTISVEGGSKTPILIIEDDPLISMMYEATFNLPGSIFEPAVFLTATEGLAHFEANKGTLHLVITDRDLPDLNGEVIAERIRQISGDPEDPHIFMISAGSPDRRQMLASGVNELLAKPFSPRNLLRIVTQTNQRFQPPIS